MTGLILAHLIFTTALVAIVAAAGLAYYLKRTRFQRLSRRRGDPAQDYAVRQDWSRSKGKLNYSSFVYFDVDRDGHYGLGDRPMNGIKVRLSSAGDHLMSSRTNSNGFANFTTSTRSRRATIRKPGTYEFAVSVPPGWEATGRNEVQSRLFSRIEGSPSGIGSDEMVRPVGLAPIRTLGGRTAAGVTAAISFLKAGETLSREIIEENSPFLIRVPSEADAIVVAGAGVDRMLTLSAYPTHLGLLSSQRAIIEAGARLKTIDFEVVTPRGLRKIPSGFAGLNWFNLNAISRDFLEGAEGYVNGAVSGDHTCYTSTGHPAEIWSGRPFGFHSVMLAASSLKSEGEVARIESWRGDDLAASDEVALSALTPVHYAPMLDGITRIRLSTKHYWQIVVDDLTLAR